MILSGVIFRAGIVCLQKVAAIVSYRHDRMKAQTCKLRLLPWKSKRPCAPASPGGRDAPLRAHAPSERHPAGCCMQVRPVMADVEKSSWRSWSSA
jgi:hypothetical protein